MKHSIAVTLILIVIFFSAQIIGLGVISKYIDHGKTAEAQKIVAKPLPFGERPEMGEEVGWVYIISAIILATAIFLLLMKFKAMNVWRVWFFLAVFLALWFAFAPFIGNFLAFILSLIFSFWKVFKPNIYIHNFTELFVYGGLAAIFVPSEWFTLTTAFLLLFAISIYDAYAVWKSKHMVKMAKFQTKSKMFAGLAIPYKIPKFKKPKRIKIRTAVLGGGDIGFPLMFAGVVMKNLLLTNPTTAFFKVLIIPVFTTIALAILLWKAEQDKFYPAMPFLTTGCVAGYLAIQLI